MPRRVTAGRGTEPVDSVDSLVEKLRLLAAPLGTDRDLDRLLDVIGEARYVLLGEASHGTSEFYTWRARISRRLIREKGFTFVAVEGDWPDCYRLNRYVKGNSGAKTAYEVLHAFERWPTWMWANREVVDFAEWLRAHNERWPEERRTGFYGLDVYSLWDSMRVVIRYLDRVDPQAGRRARRSYECFAPFGEDEQEYARATLLVPLSCEDEVVRALAELRRGAPAYREDSREAFFDAEQNALIAKNAELYYRTMIRGGAASWNVRDAHMAETLERLMAFHGPDAKAIVWAHNTHVGDARFTDMADDGEINIGQIVRERHGDEGVAIVGFSTHRGTVIAGDEWGAPIRRLAVPAGRPRSYEDVIHRLGGDDKLLLLSASPGDQELHERRGHRAIGVVYRPEYDHYGNYVPTVLPRRYDALLFIEKSHALDPLHMPPSTTAEIPETYPSGM